MSSLADRLRHSLVGAGRDDQSFIRDDLTVDDDLLKPAAVLVPIIDAPEPRVLLTVRNAALRSHAGQVAFPGGRLDPGDADVVDGALREAWEEIGLTRDLVEIVGTGQGYATNSGYMITPVVGVIPDGLSFTPHEPEVETLFEVPLAHLLVEANHLRRSTFFEGRERQYYEIDWPDQRIWGVTARLIINLAPRLRDALVSA